MSYKFCISAKFFKASWSFLMPRWWWVVLYTDIKCECECKCVYIPHSASEINQQSPPSLEITCLERQMFFKLCTLSEHLLKHNPLFAWETNKRVKEMKERIKARDEHRRKNEGRTSKHHSAVSLRLIRFIIIKELWLAEKGYDEMSHILVTTVTPVEWR